MAYIPIPESQLHNYGPLPEIGGNSTIYDLKKSAIPASAKEVLVYLWATTKGDAAFQRYYYRIQTTDGKLYYNQYMNVAASTDVSLNSANLWLPVFGDAQVTVELVGPEGSSVKGKRIGYRGSDNTNSQFFVLGHRI